MAITSPTRQKSCTSPSKPTALLVLPSRLSTLLPSGWNSDWLCTCIREWLEDLDATHRRMVGFESFACKQNYVRLMCKYSQFGHTVFTVRLASLSDTDAQAGQPFPSAQRLAIGINSQGLTIFESQSKTPREAFTFNGKHSRPLRHALLLPCVGLVPRASVPE